MVRLENRTVCIVVRDWAVNSAFLGQYFSKKKMIFFFRSELIVESNAINVDLQKTVAFF